MRRTRLLLAACTSALAMSLSAPLGASASPGASVEPSDRDAARALLEDILKIRTAKGYGQTPAQAELLAERLRAAGFTDDQIDIPTTMIDGEEVRRGGGSFDTLKTFKAYGTRTIRIELKSKEAPRTTANR